MHFPNVLLQYALDYVRIMHNATQLMAYGPVTVQLMHKTPSLSTRAVVPWILGHDPNKYKTSIPPCVQTGRPMLTLHLRTFGKSNT